MARPLLQFWDKTPNEVQDYVRTLESDLTALREENEGLKETVSRYQHVNQGACSACEATGEKNVRLREENELLKQRMRDAEEFVAHIRPWTDDSHVIHFVDRQQSCHSLRREGAALLLEPPAHDKGG